MNNKKEDKIELKLDQYRPLREIVFESLRAAIIKGELKPGTRLMEVQLAERLGVSRTPVRETIRQLELEGLVVMVPRKGAYVAGVSGKDWIEVSEIRTVLEGMAAGLAAQRASPQEIQQLSEIVERFSKHAQNKDIQGLIQEDVAFHDVIYSATGNTKLLQLISSLREQVQRLRVAYISQFDRAEDLVAEHRQIVEAISKKDSKSAREIAETHIKNGENYMIKSLGEEVKDVENK